MENPTPTRRSQGTTLTKLACHRSIYKIFWQAWRHAGIGLRSSRSMTRSDHQSLPPSATRRLADVGRNASQLQIGPTSSPWAGVPSDCSTLIPAVESLTMRPAAVGRLETVAGVGRSTMKGGVPLNPARSPHDSARIQCRGWFQFRARAVFRLSSHPASAGSPPLAPPDRSPFPLEGSRRRARATFSRR